MAQTEILRLGLDPRPAEVGAARFSRAMQSASMSAGGLTAAVGVLSGAFVALSAGRAVAGAIRATMDWETALTGVAKTVDVTTAELHAMGEELRALSEIIPVTANELAGVAEAAGQLGIDPSNIVEFTAVMADLGVATNLTAEEAAVSMARLANIMQTPQDEFDRLGATIVDLGNNLATTEREILEFGTRMAGAGKIAGLTEANILAIGGALSSVGVEAEAGGTAVQMALIGINTAVAEGNADLETFAATAGMSAQEFAAAWREDAGGAFVSFIEGLGRQGNDAATTLNELGLGGARSARSFLSLANAGDLAREALERGNVAWAENTALTEEAERFYATLANQLQVLRNRLTNTAAEVGENFVPALELAIENVDELVTGAQALAVVAGGMLLTSTVRATEAWVVQTGAVVRAAAAHKAKMVAQVQATAAEVAAAQAALRYGVVQANAAVADNARVASLARLRNAQAVHTAAVGASAAATTGWMAAVGRLGGVIGPTGWLIVGLGTAIHMFRDLKETMAEGEDVLRRQQQALRDTATEMRALGDEALRVFMIQMEQALLAARERLEELQEAQDRAGRSGGQFGVQLAQATQKVREQEAEVERLGDLIGMAAKAYVDAGQAAQDAFSGLDVGEIVRALGAGVEDPRLMESALEAQRELEAAIASGNLALDQEIAAREELQRLTNAIERAQARTTATIETGNNALREQAALLSEALDLDLERQGILSAAIQAQERLLRIARDQTRTLEEQTEAQREANRLSAAIAGHLDRATAAGEGLAGATLRLRGGFMELPDSLRETVTSMYDLGDAGADAAATFEMNWLAAIHTVGASLGGVASQMANIVGATASGGPFAGAVAAGGMVLNTLFGGPDRVEEAAREWERALDNFVDMLADSTRLDQLRSSVADQAASVVDPVFGLLERFGDFLAPALQAAIDNARSALEAGNVDAFREATADPRIQRRFEQAGLDFEEFIREWEANLARIEEIRQEDIRAMQDELAVRMLVAQGRDSEAEAMRLQQRHAEELASARELEDAALVQLMETVHAAERAALEAAQAERELAAARRKTELQMGLAAREAALWGSTMEAVTARAEAAREAELNRARAMLDAGDIGRETFMRWVRVIDGEFSASIREAEQAMRDAAQAAREAAEAERFRAAQDMRSLEVRLLQAQGHSDAAFQLRQLMELERAMHDNRSEQYIQLLQQVHAEEARARAMQEASRSMDRLNDSLRTTSRELNAPQGLPTALLRFLTAREVFGSGSGSGDALRNPGGSTQDFGVTAASPSFSAPSELRLAGAEPLETELSRLRDTIESWEPVGAFTTSPSPSQVAHSGTSRGSVQNVTNMHFGSVTIPITQQPGEDAEALARRVQTVLLKFAQDGGGNMFDTTSV